LIRLILSFSKEFLRFYLLQFYFGVASVTGN
jgi:hypothetical protein